MSAQSLYKWVKAEYTSEVNKVQNKLPDFRCENHRLRAELSRANEKRDTLKWPRILYKTARVKCAFIEQEMATTTFA